MVKGRMGLMSRIGRLQRTFDTSGICIAINCGVIGIHISGRLASDASCGGHMVILEAQE